MERRGDGGKDGEEVGVGMERRWGRDEKEVGIEMERRWGKGCDGANGGLEPACTIIMERLRKKEDC